MAYVVPPSMHWVQGCTTKVMDLWGLHIDEEVLATMITQYLTQYILVSEVWYSPFFFISICYTNLYLM